MTGVEIVDKRIKSASDFYDVCLNGKLAPKQIKATNMHFMEMKLDVLPQTMSIHTTAKMIGDYNFTRSKLLTEKIAGGVSACMGFARDDEYYVPNSNLKADVRDLTYSTSKILATFRKDIKSAKYTEMCYMAKGVTVTPLAQSAELLGKVDFNHLTALWGKPPYEAEFKLINLTDLDKVKGLILGKIKDLQDETKCIIKYEKANSAKIETTLASGNNNAVIL
ncbi:hypothetical protein FACS1894133_2480 [Clostridia bacterium]|nr:hypothetical protein FACS1894133_2480 [Clostridia bacterium]